MLAALVGLAGIDGHCRLLWKRNADVVVAAVVAEDESFLAPVDEHCRTLLINHRVLMIAGFCRMHLLKT